MTSSEALVLLAAATLCVCAVGSLLFVLPWCATSHVRYHLWAIHDAIIDDMLCGELPDAPAVRWQLEYTEACILAAPNASAVGLLIDVIKDSHLPKVERPSAGLTQAQIDRLDEYREGALSEVVLSKALLGSLSGWVLVPFLVAGVAGAGIITILRHWWRQHHWPRLEAVRRRGSMNAARHALASRPGVEPAVVLHVPWPHGADVSACIG